MSNPTMISALKKLRTITTRHEKIQWLGIAGFALVTSLFEIVTASVIVGFAQVINNPETGVNYLSRIGVDPDIKPMMAVFWFAVLVGVVYLVKNMVAAGEVFFQNFSIQKMNYNFKNRMLSRYTDMDYSLFLTRNSSYGAMVVDSDAERIYSTGMVGLACILSESIVFASLVAMIVAMNPSLAFAISGIGLVIAIAVAKILLPLYYRWGQRYNEVAVYSAQNLYQFFHAFKEIVLLGKRDFFVDSFKHYSYKRSRLQAMQAATNALPRIVIEVLFLGLFIAAIAFLCLQHDSTTQMIGILGGYMYVAFRLMPGLNRIITQLNLFKSIIPSIERVYDETFNATAKARYENVSDFSYKHDISLSHVYLTYPNTDRDALNDVTFTISKGETIGIAGETGSGKSTLVDVILGLLEPYSGTVTVDGRFPVRSQQWHRHIGYVPQSIYLMDDTVEANIAFGEKTVDQDRLMKAVKAAQLEKFINALPEGFKTIVGERGVRLSGGERQRISIARALYRDPDVLIFDEATSALDNQTEAQLMETIQTVSKGRTVIMIAHRLSTLRGCDRIVVMNNGRVEKITDYEDIAGLKKNYA